MTGSRSFSSELFEAWLVMAWFTGDKLLHVAMVLTTSRYWRNIEHGSRQLIANPIGSSEQRDNIARSNTKA